MKFLLLQCKYQWNLTLTVHLTSLKCIVVICRFLLLPRIVLRALFWSTCRAVIWYFAADSRHMCPYTSLDLIRVLYKEIFFSVGMLCIILRLFRNVMRWNKLFILLSMWRFKVNLWSILRPKKVISLVFFSFLLFMCTSCLLFPMFMCFVLLTFTFSPHIWHHSTISLTYFSSPFPHKYL